MSKSTKKAFSICRKRTSKALFEETLCLVLLFCFSHLHRELPAFKVEQPLFGFRSGRIAPVFAVFFHHPMAGHHQQQWIQPACLPHSPCSPGMPNALCHPCVGARLSVGNFLYGIPDLVLKERTLHLQGWQPKVLSLALQIVEQLLHQFRFNCIFSMLLCQKLRKRLCLFRNGGLLVPMHKTDAE